MLTSTAIIAPSTIAAYAPLRERVRAAVDALVARAPDPAPVADAIVAIAESPRPRPTYRVGAWAVRVPRMRAWMPESLFESGMRRRFGVPR